MKSEHRIFILEGEVIFLFHCQIASERPINKLLHNVHINQIMGTVMKVLISAFLIYRPTWSIAYICSFLTNGLRAAALSTFISLNWIANIY